MSFKYHELTLVNPEFGSELTNLIIELDYLRKKILRGSTPPIIFFQLKSLFHMIESIASARIEGNNTTVAEYIETKIDDINNSTIDEDYREIKNMEDAMNYIDNNISNIEIDRKLISDLHKMVVEGLEAEGDKTPGVYRTHSVSIKKSKHCPPPSDTLINQYMEELFEFINNNDKPQFDLLKCAIAHHRFVWIHPFGNGNGRTVRLFTYAMLIKQGFKVDMGNRILNPTAVFCSDRDKYYDMLSKADLGNNEGILDWCEYVLSGLKNEIEKVDKLLDYDFLKSNILYPAIEFSLERQLITDEEFKILKITVDKQTVQASDIKETYKKKVPDAAIISRNIKKLIQKKMLVSITPKGRKYTIRFHNNFLIRGTVKALDTNGFLPDKKMSGDIEEVAK